MPTAVEATTDQRTEMIAGLRSLAAFLDANPEFPTPRIYSALVVFAQDRDEFTALASQLGGHRRKASNNEFFGVTRTFGTLKVEVFTTREQVCEAKVVGTETVMVPDPNAPLIEIERDVVEWECAPSVLGGQA